MAALDVLRAPDGELDMRLALGAVAAWLAILAVLDRPPGTVLAVAIAAGLGGAALLAGSRVFAGRLERVRAVALVRSAALMLFAIVLVLIPLAGRLAHARAAPLATAARTHAAVTADLTLDGDPQTLAAKGVAGTPRVAVPTTADSVRIDGRSMSGDGDVLVLAPARGWADLLPGQRVRVEGTLQPSLDSPLSVTLNAPQAPERIGDPPWWQRAAGAVRASLRQAAAVLPEPERGLLPGLVDGDTGGLDPVLAERFRTAGLTHLVAVSGTNCSIVVGVVLLLLRRARVRPWLSAVLGGLALVAFVVVARPTPSVLRAAAMACIALVALATGRPRAALPALAAGVLGLLVWDPLLATDVGFAMSAVATAALLVIAPPWAAALRRHGVPGGLAEAIAVAASAHVVTAPLIAGLAGRVSIVAVPANVLAEPVVAVTTVLGFAAALAAPLSTALGASLAWLAGWPCRWLTAVAEFFGGLHGATVPWPGGVAGGLLLLVALGVLAVLLTWRTTRPIVAAAAVVAVLVQFPVRSAVSGWPVAGWVFVACDVGQGDALVLNAGGGAGVVVDTGPEPVSTDRCLRDLGISSVPALFLTHFHLDHVGGLAGVLRGRSVGRILTGPLAEPASGVALVESLARPRGLALATPLPGASFDFGAVHLDVLGPAHAFHGTRSDPNNSSLVMRATVHGVRILLSGDAEVEAQRALVDSHVDLSADVLKVWHHGSAYFDPDYLAAVHARTAIISVGAHNDYGHPSPLALRALAQAGIPMSRTDQDGDVAVAGHDHAISTVRRGIAASTVALRASPPIRTAVLAALSGPDAKMPVCRPVRLPQPTCPPRCPAPSCSSGTRNFSSTGPSARSPPPAARPIRRWPRRFSRAARSRGRSWPRCSVRRCSVTRGWW